jgi:hypothetical protein
MRMPFTRLAATLLGAGSLALLACGSSDKLSAACKDQIALNQGVTQLFMRTPALQTGRPVPKAAVPQLRADYDRFVATPLAKFEKDAPDKISADVRSAAATARGLREGNVSGLMAPQFMATTARIDGYLFDKCSGEKSDVKGVDYGFQGLKASYPAGTVRFKLDNVGKEEHEMALLRRKPGVTESFAQLFKLPMAQAQSKVDFVGSADGVPPGKASYAALNLTPGQYVAVCFIPQGSTPGKQGKGPPHVALGMQKSFSVK